MDSGSGQSAKQVGLTDDGGSLEASQRHYTMLPWRSSLSLETLQRMQDNGTLPEGLELVRHDNSLMPPPDSWVPGYEAFDQNEHTTKDGEALVKEFKYKIDLEKDEFLGNGMSGVVYQHKEAKVGFVFAYKVISIEGSNANLDRYYAYKEYSALAGLHRLEHPHPNIITLLDLEAVNH